MGIIVVTNDNAINEDYDRTVIEDSHEGSLLLNQSLGDKITKLNDNLIFNSKESAIKKYIHEPIGIIEGIELVDIQSDALPPTLTTQALYAGAICPKKVEFTFFGHISLSKGWLNGVYLYKNAYDYPSDYQGYSFNNYKGSFLVENDEEVFSYFNKSKTSYFSGGVWIEEPEVINNVLYFVLKLDDDDFLEGNFIFSNKKNIMKDYPGSYIEIGSVINEERLNANSDDNYIIFDQTALSPLGFCFSLSAFTDYDEFNRLSRGSRINLMNHFLPISDDLDYLTLDDVEIEDELIISTNGYDLNFIPKYINNNYMIVISFKLDYGKIYKCQLSIDNEETYIDSLLKFTDSGVYYFELSEFTGSYFLKIKVEENTKITSVKFNMDIDYSLPLSGELTEGSLDKEITDASGELKAFLNLPFTYAGIGRSLDFYFSKNEINRGYLIDKFNHTSFDGLTPLHISHDLENTSFYVTPINFRGNGEMLFEDNLLNSDYSRKGFPLILLKMIPFTNDLPPFKKHTFISLKSDFILPEKVFVTTNVKYPHFNTNVESKSDFIEKVLIVEHSDKPISYYISLDDYIENKELYNSVDIDKFLVIYFSEDVPLVGRGNSSYCNEVKIIRTGI